ncbi:MAG: DUF1858 domain-containing protein [Lachnospiraceae bacterium]|nr:DUF1858 domain-containing protein [Lachnospiraceae bacterium]
MADKAVKKITKDMTVVEALRVDPRVADLLMAEGMHCVFCGAAAGESIQQAGYVHGYDDAAMSVIIDDINHFLAEAPADEPVFPGR